MYRALAMGAVIFGLIVLVVLLITCDNVAVLTAIRAAARSPEIGVRLALGASRARIVFQLVVELGLVCAAAGIVGMYLAFVTARFATQFYLPVPMPFALTFKPDWRVFAFAILASSAATMLCGLVPALKTLNTDLVAIVKGTGLKPRMQSGLVTAQVTLSTALLIAAAVLAHSVIGNVSRPRSFTSDGVVMTTMALPESTYPPERRFALLRTLLDTVEQPAGVSAASIVLNVPVANNAATTPVEARANGRVARAQVNVASRGLFRTLSVPMLAGRDFLPSDDANPEAVVIVNESLARAFWSDGNPVGESLVLGSGTTVRVIGLVRDIETEPSTRRVLPMLYRPLAYEPPRTPTVLFKVPTSAATLVPLVRLRLSQLDPDIGAYNVMWLDERLDLGLVLNRVAAIAGGVLGLLALALGAFGIYGTIASVVQQRRREIGIRLALGASRLQVVQLIAIAGMRSSIAGVACGVALGALATFGLSRVVHVVAAVDLPAFAAIRGSVAGRQLGGVLRARAARESPQHHGRPA
jgi:predicted permease